MNFNASKYEFEIISFKTHQKQERLAQCYLIIFEIINACFSIVLFFVTFVIENSIFNMLQK